jgi:DNA polymerase-3 subunit gamma/tau
MILMTIELYKRYRPSSLKDLVGQAAAVQTIQQLGRNNSMPHSLLFSGPSGCGKTTAARILADKLGCHGADLQEINAAEARGIDEVRDIQRQMSFRPFESKFRIWILNEVHEITKNAANALLVPLEDTPEHVFFFLTTTDPQKLIRPIRTRCTEIKLGSIDWRDLEQLVNETAAKEDKPVSQDVVDKIIKLSDGSARQALVFLHQVIDIPESDRLRALEAEDVEALSIELCRALMDAKTSWKTVSGLLKNIKDDPEKIRWSVLAYATKSLLGGNPAAYVVIDSFRENFFNSKMAGLAAACWEVKNGG